MDPPWRRVWLFILFNLLSVGLNGQSVTFRTNNASLEQAFAWARYKALSFAHSGKDPVGPWYEAALPNRDAFCMRDVAHQSIGAEILGLGKHNENMYRKFAGNITPEKDYCSFWEINRLNKPASVDYENDKDFWYNLPANFDILYNAWRLYQWTGNRVYLDDPSLKNFYAVTLNQYVDHWDIGATEVATRNRSIHTEGAKRFGAKRGIPTYNEGGRGETRLGIDLTAAQIAACNAYGQMLSLGGQAKEAELIGEQEERERKFLEDFWWDPLRQQFRSIQYADRSFDYFMVGTNQSYLHYLLYFNVLEDSDGARRLTDLYRDNHKNLIVELKSYLPTHFYEHGYTTLANELIIELCSPSNPRRDYPEVSFTVIEHITRGLLGVEPDAAGGKVSTLSRLQSPDDWVDMSNIPVLGRRITVSHNGKVASSVTNQSNMPIGWQACFYGLYPVIYIDGRPKPSTQIRRDGQEVSFVTVAVPAGAHRTASIK